MTLLDSNWLAEGYSSKSHEKKAKAGGRNYLAAFYNNFEKEPFKTIKVEEPFILRLTPDLKIAGRIDRIDKLEKGIELIDYKTGYKTPTQKEVDNNFQLTVYALAATNQGVLNKKPEELTLSLYFLENGTKIKTKRTKEQLKQAEKEIIKIAEEISESDFSPKVSNRCDFCEYRMLCDAWK